MPVLPKPKISGKSPVPGECCKQTQETIDEKSTSDIAIVEQCKLLKSDAELSASDSSLNISSNSLHLLGGPAAVIPTEQSFDSNCSSPGLAEQTLFSSDEESGDDTRPPSVCQFY